jgi:ABC-type Zn2+ transport system substrate-binding protein/surface adhesin
MRIKVNQKNYILIWLKILVSIRMGIKLTNIQYKLLEYICKTANINKTNRRSASQKLKISYQVITNNIKFLKDKSLLVFDSVLREYKPSPILKYPKTIEDLSNYVIKFELD